ncbi:MAG: SulP family inorganic anion transporter [Microbacteriaceae bacterium]
MAASTLKFDVPAGIVVALVALPLALGFGVTSGAGAASGLVTAIVAGLLAGVLGGSRFQVSGPTGAMVVVLFPIIAQVGVVGLVAVGVIAGLIIAALGLFRLGALVEKVPWSVMEGFTLGIAVVIALQQLPLVFGVERGAGTETLVVAWNTIQNAVVHRMNGWAVALVLAALLLKAVWVRVQHKVHRLKVVPPSAIAVLVLSVIVVAFGVPVAQVGPLPADGLFHLELGWPNLPLGTLVYSAVVVAALGAIESLLSARVADSMVHRRDGVVAQPFSPNRELIGQGVATVVSSLVGGMPATGAIARTAVNVNAGARTRAATVTHALVLVLFVFALGSVVSEIPLAVLAGVLLGASWRIASPTSIAENFRTTWPNRLGYLVTAISVVAIDLIWGIVLGTAVYALANLISRRAKPGSNTMQPQST